MSERSSLRLFPKNTLITPSASPPGSHFSFSSPVRDSLPPPTKKRRFASTPSSSSFSASTPISSSSSSSRLDPTHDLHNARRASSSRVLDIWSSLAARYNRRIDEDDVIDLLTGNVIKDRGVLKELPEYAVGYFADADDPLNLGDTNSEGGGVHTEPEDDVDQIDAFAQEAEDLRLEPKLVPPVQVMDPADADDLRDFLEAERIRRELDGEDDEYSDEDLHPPLKYSLDASSPGSKSSVLEITDDSPSKASSDNDSDDEFGAWAVDEGSTVYQVVSEPEIDGENEESPLKSPSPASQSLPCSPVMKKPPDPSKAPHLERPKPTPVQKQLQTPRSTVSVQERSLDEIDIQFPPPPIRSRSKSIKPKKPVDGTFSSPESPKSNRNPKSKQKVSVLITRKPKTSDAKPAIQNKDKSGTDLPHPSPPTSPEFQEGSSHGHNRRAKSKTKSSKLDLRNSKVDESPLSRSHKRKRTVSSSSMEEDKGHGDNVDSSSSEKADVGLKSRSKSKSRSRQQEKAVYPYSIPYASQPAQYPPNFQPIQDPNAQYIIAQAMHQLAYLVSGPPPPPNGWSSQPGPGYPTFTPPYPHTQWPFTPTQHLDSSGARSSPSTPHHPHPYPFMFDPSLSRATLPPSSPQETPLPSKGKGSKSLGRKVSFKLDSPPKSRRGSKSKKGSLPGKRGKTRAQVAESSEEDSEDSDIEIVSSPSRPPKVERGRTPGPPSLVREVKGRRGQ